MAPALVVLLVDDQPIVAAAVRKMLAAEPDLTVVVCHDALAAERVAAECQPMLILQDLIMPSRDGFTLLSAYRRSPSLADVPVIVLSSAESPVDKSRAFELGATDYLIKLPDRVELIARIRAHVRSYVAHRQLDDAYRELDGLRRQLVEKNAMLEQISTLDGLTGIANRRRYDTALDAEWRRSRRDGEPLTLALMDVDDFKKYNDALGHLQGDECLKRVAGALAGATFRPGDLIARYGGEEFVAVLPATDRVGATSVTERMRSAVFELAIPHPRSQIADRVTVSVGVATARPAREDVGDASSLVARADDALYRAKRAGRNRCVYADDLP